MRSIRANIRLHRAILGILLLLLGTVMLVLPGPGLVSITAGLSLLTPRFRSAERLLTVIHRRTTDASRLRALAIVAAIDIAVIVAGIGTVVLADAPLLPS